MDLCLLKISKLKNFKFTNNEFKEGDEITFTVGGFQYTIKEIDKIDWIKKEIRYKENSYNSNKNKNT